MTAKGMCCTIWTIFHPSTWERRNTKSWNWELFQIICRFLAQFLSHPSPLIAQCVPFYLSLSHTFVSCTSVCFLSLRRSMMASLFSAKGDFEADLKTLGSGEAISLPCGIINLREGRGFKVMNIGMALSSSGSWHAQRLVCGGEQMRWSRGQTKAKPLVESTKRKLIFQL